MSDRSERTVRVGVVGLGSVARLHIEAYATLPRVEVVGGADPSQAARAAAAERFGLRCYASAEELLGASAVELLCVLSPAATHREIVEIAAGAGVAVLCEKPLAPTVADAEAMVKACEDANVPFAYGASYRYLGAVSSARTLVRAGAIGQVRLVVEQAIGGSGLAGQQTFGPQHYPAGGPGGSTMGLVDHGIHFLDLVPWLLARQVVSVFGRGNTSGGELGPEFAVLDLDGGVLGQLVCFDGTWSTALPNEGGWLSGAGWDGTGKYLPAGSWGRNLVEIHVFGSDGALRIVPYGHRVFLADDSGVRSLDVDGPAPPQHFALQLADFVDAIQRGAPPPVPGEAGVEALRVLHAAYESQASGRAVSPQQQALAEMG